MKTSPRRVAVLGGNRIPFARSNTAYATASNQEMLTAAIDGLAARFGLEGQRRGAGVPARCGRGAERFGEAVASAVLKHGRAYTLRRESVRGSRWAPETPATDL